MMRLLLLGLLALPISVSASVQKLETELGSVYVPQLPQWELGRNMYGMPFIYFSPRANGQRSNISFTFTGVDVELDLAVMGKDAEGFRRLKENWAKTVEARIDSVIPYRSWKNQHDHTVHEVGVSYTHEGKRYLEKSFYVNCRRQLVYSKALRLLDNASHEAEFTRLVNELDCGQ